MNDPIEIEVQAKAGHLSLRQQRILREMLTREYKENGMEDYTYGSDDEPSQTGAQPFK